MANSACAQNCVKTKTSKMTKNRVPAVVSVQKTATLQANLQLDYAVLEGDLCVYKFSTQFEQTAGPKKIFENTRKGVSIQGFARLKSIEAFKAGRTSSIARLDKLVYQPLEVLELARTRGFQEAAQNYAKDCENVFDLFAQGKLELDGIAHWEVGGQMLFDRHGQVLPAAIFFNYMNGRFANGVYDLEKALKVLSRRKDVAPIKGEQLTIEEVPYYNCSPGCSQHIEFWFQPTVKQMRALWEVMQRMNKQYPSTMDHEAVFELDMLGLRKAGAAKYDSYYSSDEYNSSDEDDED